MSSTDITSNNSLSQTSENVNNKFSEKIGKAEYEKGYYFNAKILSNVNLSAYGKYNYKNCINTARNEGRILYINKSNQPRNIPGVQFPNNILNADYSSSISNYRKNVNDFMKKFSNIIKQKERGAAVTSATSSLSGKRNKISSSTNIISTNTGKSQENFH